MSATSSRPSRVGPAARPSIRKSSRSSSRSGASAIRSNGSPRGARCSGSWPKAAQRGDRAALVVSDGAVEKHVRNIFSKLDLAPADPDHRRVLAVLQWVRS